MKKTILTLVVFASFANLAAQLEVKSSGDTYVAKNIYLESASNFNLGTTNNVPITFKVNNSVAGFTGYSGKTNVSFGYQSLSNLYMGDENVAIGVGALRNSSYGWENTATGYYALYNNFDGWDNTATGHYALYYNTDGSNNTAIGCSALSGNTIGYGNTAIGYNANVSINNLNNTITIGYNAKAIESNTVVIGNSAITKASIGTIWSTTSDGRTKKNIRENVPGLAFINRLQPVTYNFDLNALDELQKSDDPKINALQDSLRMARSLEVKEIEAKARANKEKIVYSGFIAQDVEKAARSVGYDFSGVDAPENGKGAYGLRYAEFVVPLVKAVQELSEQNEAKDAAIASLQEQVNKLTELVNQLTVKEDAPAILKSGSGNVSGIESPELSTDGASLEQNVPNPFSEKTEIRFFLPENVKQAYICIFDMQGSMLKKTTNLVEQSTLMIQGSELKAGMYLYSLIADGKEVDTKRMILTQ